MKRSQMLSILAHAIDDVMEKRYSNCTGANQLALAVLGVVEASGMLPPDSKGILDQWNEGYIAAPEWDSENE